MKIIVINGANMDVLDRRESIYGGISLKELKKTIKEYGNKKSLKVEFFQSNCEGKIIDRLHKCEYADGLIINPGAYSHYSYAIADALSMLNITKVEVHLTDVYSREAFRQKLITGEKCDKIISGLGVEGYLRAIDFITEANS